MSKAQLAIVPSYAEPAAPNRAQRIADLQAEARKVAGEHVELFTRLLVTTSAMAREIAGGGDAYPVGVRELAGRLAADLPDRALTVKAISSRAA